MRIYMSSELAGCRREELPDVLFQIGDKEQLMNSYRRLEDASRFRPKTGDEISLHPLIPVKR